MENTVGSEEPVQFSLVEGGLFHRPLGRLGLLGKDRLPTWRTALVLAWAPPAILDIAQTLLQTDYSGWGFFKDQTVYTRYLVAIVAMIVTERIADRRMSVLMNEFIQARLLDSKAREKFRAIIARADRNSSRSFVEGILLALALAWSWLSFYYVSEISDNGWEEWSSGGETQLSWAGTSAELWSNPIFLFLVFRWLWHFLVWSALLFRVSKLPLKLSAIHPDRSGGLGFLALFPGIFIGVVFALSCVVSSSLLKTMSLVTEFKTFIWLIICGWVLFMIFVILAPLLFFSLPMLRTRDKAMIEYGRLAQAHHQAFRETWVDGNRRSGALLGSPDPSSAAELNDIVQTALGMRIVPLDLAAFLQILIAAVVPFIAVVVSLIPLTDLLQWFMSAIF